MFNYLAKGSFNFSVSPKNTITINSISLQAIISSLVLFKKQNTNKIHSLIVQQCNVNTPLKTFIYIFTYIQKQFININVPWVADHNKALGHVLFIGTTEFEFDSWWVSTFKWLKIVSNSFFFIHVFLITKLQTWNFKL